MALLFTLANTDQYERIPQKQIKYLFPIKTICFTSFDTRYINYLVRVSLDWDGHCNYMLTGILNVILSNQEHSFNSIAHRVLAVLSATGLKLHVMKNQSCNFVRSLFQY